MTMSFYMWELLGLMAVFSFMIISPGADTAIVLRQSVVHGRRAGIATSVGIGFSQLFHMSYTILGLGLIISQSLLLFSLLKWAGVVYLLYLGYQAFTAPSFDLTDSSTFKNADQAAEMSDWHAFLIGFATNALNPKPVLFFLSFFSTLVSAQTPALVKFVYGGVMAASLIAWFVAVSCFLTVPAMRAWFTRASRWINRVTGVVFVTFGLKLAFTKASN